MNGDINGNKHNIMVCWFASFLKLLNLKNKFKFILWSIYSWTWAVAGAEGITVLALDIISLKRNKLTN